MEDERDSRSTSRAAEGVVTAMPKVALLGYPLDLTFEMMHTFLLMNGSHDQSCFFSWLMSGQG